MKTWTKRLAVSAGALALAVGFAGASVFADGPTDSGTTATPSSSDPATPTPGADKATQDVCFTKTFIAPAKSAITEIPAATHFTFTFGIGEFYPYLSTDVATKPDGSVTAPTIAPQDIPFTYGELVDGTDGTSSVTKQSTNVIAGLTWTKPGVYKYNVAETKDTADLSADPEKDEIAYDASNYELAVYVTYDANGDLTATGGVSKVDPKDPTKSEKVTSTPVTPTDPTVDGDKTPAVVPTPAAGTFNFENKYSITTSKVPDEIKTGKEGPFWISKTVAGKLADQAKEFDFNILITPSKLTAQKYTVYVKNAKGETKIAAGQEVIPGTPTLVKLAHGDVAYFTEITVGEQVTVTETDTPDYAETSITNLIGDAGTKGLEVKGLLAATGNQAEYTNTFDGPDVTPTGILMNNLPYLALIVAGVAGLGFYFVNKRRHNA